MTHHSAVSVRERPILTQDFCAELTRGVPTRDFVLSYYPVQRYIAELCISSLVLVQGLVSCHKVCVFRTRCHVPRQNFLPPDDQNEWFVQV